MTRPQGSTQTLSLCPKLRPCSSLHARLHPSPALAAPGLGCPVCPTPVYPSASAAATPASCAPHPHITHIPIPVCLHPMSPVPHSHASLCLTLHLPRLCLPYPIPTHCSPVKPGAHRHCPPRGSQRPPLWQRHSPWQPGPKRPGGHGMEQMSPCHRALRSVGPEGTPHRGEEGAHPTYHPSMGADAGAGAGGVADTPILAGTVGATWCPLGAQHLTAAEKASSEQTGLPPLQAPQGPSLTVGQQALGGRGRRQWRCCRGPHGGMGSAGGSQGRRSRVGRAGGTAGG